MIYIHKYIYIKTPTCKYVTKIYIYTCKYMYIDLCDCDSVGGMSGWCARAPG